jgi:hypothetical protein
VVRVWHGPRLTGLVHEQVVAHERVRPGDWTYIQVRWPRGGFGFSSDRVAEPTSDDRWLHARVQRGLRALPRAARHVDRRRDRVAPVVLTG